MGFGFLIDIVAVTFVVFACAGFGRKMMRVLRVPEGGFCEEFASGAALGIGVLIVIIFLLGLTGLLRWWTAALPPLLMVAVTPKDFASVFSSAALRTRDFFRRGDPLTRAVAAAGVAFFLLYLPSALCPPLHPDALVYHLAAPKIYAQAGRIVFLPSNYRASLPSGVEMLFTMGMAIRGYAMAQLFHLALCALSAIAVYAAGKRYSGVAAGVWAAFVFSTLYIVSVIAPQAMNEFGFVLFALLAFNYMFRWTASGARGDFIMSALFAGFAMTTRYQAAVWVFCLCGMIAVDAIKKKKRFIATAGRIGVFGIAASAMLLPWMIRNAADTGNPFFPILNQFFGNRFFNGADWMWMISGQFRPDSLIGNIRLILLYPWLATTHGFSPDTGYMLPASPVWIALTPAILFFRPLPKFVRATVVFCAAAGLLFAALFLVIPRFWLPMGALLCIPIGYAVSEARTKFKPVFFALAFFVALNAAFTAYSLAGGVNSVQKQLSFISGRTSAESFISTRNPTFKVIEWANLNLPPDAKVMFGFNTGQGYYLDRAYIYGEPFNQTYLDWYGMKSGAEMLRRMREIGVTHVILDSHYLRPEVCFGVVDKPQCVMWNEVLDKHLKVLAIVNNYAVGRIDY